MSQSFDLKLLKFVVIFMGIALVGGIIFLFSVIYSRNKAYVASLEENNAECVKDINLNIKGKAKYLDNDNGNIVLQVANADSISFIIIDACSGEVTKNITLYQVGR